MNFATGGGKRVSSKAIKLKGSLSGTNVFYTLKDCPAALSVGMQVNEHKQPFIWMPDQLPFLIKADRVQDMTFHCLESAKTKIYADRVVENVLVLSESVVGVAMQAQVEDVPLAPGESSSSRGDSSRPSFHGEPFTGWRIPFGALVYYKPPKHRELPSFSAGW